MECDTSKCSWRSLQQNYQLSLSRVNLVLTGRPCESEKMTQKGGKVAGMGCEHILSWRIRFPWFFYEFREYQKGGGKKREKYSLTVPWEREQGWCLKTNEEDKTMISITVSIPQSLHTWCKRKILFRRPFIPGLGIGDRNLGRVVVGWDKKYRVSPRTV